MSAVDLARSQFARTSIYHFLFLPVTIGLALLTAVLQTRWYPLLPPPPPPPPPPPFPPPPSFPLLPLPLLPFSSPLSSPSAPDSRTICG